jgi:hypothetical protein
MDFPALWEGSDMLAQLTLLTLRVLLLLDLEFKIFRKIPRSCYSLGMTILIGWSLDTAARLQ